MEYLNITKAQIKYIDTRISRLRAENEDEAVYIKKFIRMLESFSFICPRQREDWFKQINDILTKD